MIEDKSQLQHLKNVNLHLHFGINKNRHFSA